MQNATLSIQPNQEVHRVKKVIAAASVAAFALTGCGPTTMGRGVSAASPTLEAEPVNPYSSDGQWLVPEEIAPGNYRVALRPGESHGYGAVCGDYECNPFGEPGMIANDNYYGPGVMVVPQLAVMVEIRGITLTPMPTRP